MSATRQVTNSLLTTILIFFWHAPLASAQDTPLKIAAKRKPTDSQWQYYDTRTVGNLAGFNLTADNPKLDQYGGVDRPGSNATGFFYTRKIEDRWWLIDPLGHRFLHIGVCSVAAGKSAMDREATKKRFAGDAQWARTTNDLLRDHRMLPRALARHFREVAEVVVDLEPSVPQRLEAVSRARNAALVVCGVYTAGLTPGLAALVAELAETGTPLAAVLACAPYAAAALPPAVRAVVCCFGLGEQQLEAAAALLAGKLAPAGRLPVTVSPALPRGGGLALPGTGAGSATPPAASRNAPAAKK